MEMNIEAANFRVMLDQLFHSMPITSETPAHVQSILKNLSHLVYIEGKEGVVRARDFLERLEADNN